jgi:hypothetical protein
MYGNWSLKNKQIPLWLIFCQTQTNIAAMQNFSLSFQFDSHKNWS